ARYRAGLHRAHRAALSRAHPHRRGVKGARHRRNRHLLAEGHERLGEDAAVAIPPRRAGFEFRAPPRADLNRPRPPRSRAVITPSIADRDLAARLDAVPARLRTAIARAFEDVGDRLNVPLTIDASTDAITATLRTAGVPPTLSRRRASARTRIIYRKGRKSIAKDAMVSERLRLLPAAPLRRPRRFACALPVF